ncbi:reverse transcriptase domain-containing protein [Tanacetum coccineum]
MEDDFKPVVQHQRQVNPKIYEVINAEVIKLLDAGLIYPISDSHWGLGASWVMPDFIGDLSKIAQLMTHLFEKDTPFFFSSECQSFFVILKKKLAEAPILVSTDWDLPFELICDASDFAVGAVLGQRKDKYFRPIHYASKTLSDAQTYYTITEKELLAVVYAFEKFWSYLVLSKTIVYTDHSALKYLFAKHDAKLIFLWWVLLLQEFNIEICDKKGVENLAADYLSRLENPYQGDHVGMEINDNFPHETLNMIFLNPDNEPSWFADIANDLVGNVLIKGMSSQQKKNSLRMFYIIFGMTPISFGFVLIRLFDGVWTGRKLWIFSRLATMVPPGDIMARNTPPRKFLTLVFSGPPYIAMPMTLSQTETHVNIREKSHRGTKCPKILFRFVEMSNHGLKRISERTVGEHRAKWADKLDDALWAFRTAFKTPIGCTPYNLAYENSLIYKEKMKKIHDATIKNREFHIGDRVLFNSRLKIFSGKLKSHWSGPFTVAEVFPYGTIELSQPDGPNFKVNGHQIKYCYGGDILAMDVPDLYLSPKDN